MSDPVADKSGFLRMYMSNHPDVLIAYAKYYGHLKNTDVANVRMSHIDSKKMTLAYTMKGSKEEQEVHVSFQPPLSGYDEVKPRLISMSAEAQEKLGMIRAPQIDTFELPIIPCLQSAALMIFCAYWTVPLGSSSPLFYPAIAAQNAIGGMPTAKILWSVIWGVHCFESAYSFVLCRRARTSLIVGALYVGSTIIFGAPVWRYLQKRIQTARIDSVMKKQ